MAADDRAIVVGVKDYPSLGNLDGPENDAKDFQAWLLDDEGGAVPPDNVRRILSSDFQATQNPLDAEPTTVRLERAFDELYELGDSRNGKVGRRLYIYLAGHGFAPSLEDAALLMANAGRGRSGHHVSGRNYANWFRQSAFFDEVVLFMDCCREHSARAGVRPVPYDPLSARAPARHLYGFATEWSRASRERPVGAKGQIQGLFTVALLAGLRGGAPRNPAGQVTAETLVNFVHSYLPQLTEAQQVERQDPDFDYYKPAPIVFSSAPPVRFHLRVTLSAADAGKTVEVLDGTFQPVAGTKTSLAQWEWDVPAGMYKVQVQGGPSRVLELIGAGGPVDVAI
jgi:uncharacterized caspase-like protein